VAAFDAPAKQSVPRWATNDEATQKAYDAYVQKVCPCVIIVHSQGGNFAFNAALHAPDKIKAVVAVEPSGAPDPAKVDIASIKGVPHLFVWGDHLADSAPWQKFIVPPTKYREAIVAAGGTADWIDLPKQGIAGNTHMLMMNRNSDQIAALVQEWLVKHGLVTP
jgi:pimeloyl-ACP methyl ester carboxylesterase